jgi:iron complex transport system permease protein
MVSADTEHETRCPAGGLRRRPAFPAGTAKLLILAGAILIAVVFSFAVGRFAVSPVTAVEILASRIIDIPRDWPSQAETIVLVIRLPRIGAALLVGLGLSAAGAALQGLLRNPLVSPDILGVSAGAGFGASLGMLMSLGPMGVQALAFGGGLLAVVTTYAIALRFGRTGETALRLILSGIIIAALFQAFISALKFIADPDNTLPAITYWLIGSLSLVDARDVYVSAGPILAGFLLLMALRWHLNIMALGEEEARALGVNTRLVRSAVIVAATLMTAAAVAISGVIALVGLIVPHIARAYVGPNFSALIPGSALLGALLVVLMDNLARSMFSTELPLGVLTEIIGALFFLFLLSKTGQAWA